MLASRSGADTGSGRSRTAFSTVNIVVVDAMPNAMVSTAARQLDAAAAACQADQALDGHLDLCRRGVLDVDYAGLTGAAGGDGDGRFAYGLRKTPGRERDDTEVGHGTVPCRPEVAE